jgi:hypothetical protein
MEQMFSGPMRADDFVHSRNSRLDLLEQIAALDRLSLEAITPVSWGYWVRLNGSSKLYKWWCDHEVQQHALLDSIELHPYGTCLLLNRQIGVTPYSRYGAICSWADLPRAAEHLRQSYVGPALWNTYGEGILESYTAEIIRALSIPEAALNSSQLPSHCAIKWGKLLRIDSANLERVISYFVVERPLDCQRPFLADLGAKVFAVFAFGSAQEEPLRIGLCRNWHDDLAIKDLSRWLKVGAKSPKPREPPPDDLVSKTP